MIKKVETLKDYTEFVDCFYAEGDFIDPHIISEEDKINLLTQKRETKESLVILSGNKVIGAFVLLVLPDELYIEMLLGLSKEEKAYLELFEYLKSNYKGYNCDFVFNAKNYLLKNILKGYDATFETEQMKMIYSPKKLDMAFDEIKPLKDKYCDEYLNIHEKDTYWTGEKVIKAKDRFSVYVALDNDKVIGYIDVTKCFKENEPYDIYVKEEYRNKEYGKKLLAKALYENKDNDMMLLVDIDNIVAIKVYKKCGFIEDKYPHYLTAHISILL